MLSQHFINIQWYVPIFHEITEKLYVVVGVDFSEIPSWLGLAEDYCISDC